MNLNNYCNSFLKELLNEFPAFKNHYILKKYNDRNEVYLYIEIPYRDIWISTFHDNITIGFEDQHTHFSFHDTDEEDFNAAIQYIKKLIIG